MGSWRERPVLLVVGALVLIVAIVYGAWLAEPEEPADVGGGEVHVAHVENNYTERVDVLVFTVTDDERIVEGNASTVPRGATMDYGTLSCLDGHRRATHLRVMLRLGAEGEYDEDRFLQLEDDDCRQDGGAVFAVTVTGAGELAVERR